MHAMNIIIKKRVPSWQGKQQLYIHNGIKIKIMLGKSSPLQEVHQEKGSIEHKQVAYESQRKKIMQFLLPGAPSG
jgi:hypothetical protein